MNVALGSNVDLVRLYVAEILNGTNIHAISQLFNPRFVDHDPLRIPGVIRPTRSVGTVADVRQQTLLLAMPGVDIKFHLEDVFQSPVGDVAYRVFGQGTVPLAAPDENGSALPRAMRVPGTSLAFVGSNDQRVLGNELHLAYRCVGIFRVSDGKLMERWGVMQIE